MSDDPAKFPFPASDRIRLLSVNHGNQQSLEYIAIANGGSKELLEDKNAFICCVPFDVDEDGYVTVFILFHERKRTRMRKVKKADIETKTTAVRALKITQDIRSNSSNQVYFKSGDVVELLVE
eukprot:15092_1